MSKYEATGIEAELLEGLYTRVFSQSLQQLTFSDIKAWHRQWLGNLYDWAGQLRSVNVSKEGWEVHTALISAAVTGKIDVRNWQGT